MSENIFNQAVRETLERLANPFDRVESKEELRELLEKDGSLQEIVDDMLHDVYYELNGLYFNLEEGE